VPDYALPLRGLGAITEIAALDDLQLGRTNWSAYTCQCWMCEGKCDPQICPKTGDAKHQKNVKHIMSQLGLKPKETFATNLVFVESDDIPTLKREPFFRDNVDACWQVHKKMLAEIRPKYIVCLGNGENDSAYSLVRKKAYDVKNEKPSDKKVGRCRAFKKFVGGFHFDEGEPLDVIVVGVLHPSRWQCPSGLVRFIESK
jgi:hypothetical protein